MRDILDEKESILRTKSEEVTFPLTKEDKKTIKDIIEMFKGCYICEKRNNVVFDDS